MPDSREFKHESLQDMDSIVHYLQAVIDGVRQGRLRLSADQTEVVLEPRGVLRFRIEAKRSKSRERLAIRLSWRARDDEEEAAPPESLRITPMAS